MLDSTWHSGRSQLGRHLRGPTCLSFLDTLHHGNEASIQSTLEDVHGEQSCLANSPHKYYFFRKLKESFLPFTLASGLHKVQF